MKTLDLTKLQELAGVPVNERHKKSYKRLSRMADAEAAEADEHAGPRSTWDKIKEIPDWYFDSFPMIKLKDKITLPTWKKIKNRLKKFPLVNDDISVDDANIILEHYESIREEMTKLRELAGLPIEEAMISGDWENLGITNDDLEPDDAFGGGAWSVGLGGPNSQFFWFKEQDTGTHFATVTDIGNGTWKIEDGDGRAIGDAGITSWDEVESIVGKMFLGPRSAHDETPSAEEYR